MLLYTNEPYEMIFAKDGAPRVKAITVPEGIVEAAGDNDGSLSVSRLISTDPRAYLNSKYAPGRKIGGLRQ